MALDLVLGATRFHVVGYRPDDPTPLVLCGAKFRDIPVVAADLWRGDVIPPDMCLRCLRIMCPPAAVPEEGDTK